jgi:hypothetical protein
MNTLVNAIKANINANGMTFISYVGIGDGSKVFNKGSGAKAMVECMGHENTAIEENFTKTVLVGGDYQKMQNNRIAKAVKKLLTEVELAGGDELAEAMLNAIIEKGKEGTAFKSQGLPYGKWVEGFEGILIETEDGDIQLRTYDETPNNTTREYFLNGEIFDIDSKDYSQWRKPAKKKSGKISELNQALSKILDLENEDIKDALGKLKPIFPQNISLGKTVKSITINGQTFTK